MLSPFESMEDQNPPAEFYIAARAYSRDFFSENTFLQFLSLSLFPSREKRSANIFYSNKRGVLFTNWKEMEKLGEEKRN